MEGKVGLISRYGTNRFAREFEKGFRTRNKKRELFVPDSEGDATKVGIFTKSRSRLESYHTCASYTCGNYEID